MISNFFGYSDDTQSSRDLSQNPVSTRQFLSDSSYTLKACAFKVYCNFKQSMIFEFCKKKSKFSKKPKWSNQPFFLENWKNNYKLNKFLYSYIRLLSPIFYLEQNPHGQYSTLLQLSTCSLGLMYSRIPSHVYLLINNPKKAVSDRHEPLDELPSVVGSRLLTSVSQIMTNWAEQSKKSLCSNAPRSTVFLGAHRRTRGPVCLWVFRAFYSIQYM